MTGYSISVVFVTYNRKELLRQAISAVLQQSIPAEVIVMDDGSTDGTEVMVKEHFPRIQFFRSTENVGPSHLRNEGAKKATCPIVCFLDDDTILKDDHTLETVLKDFNQDCVGAVALPFINILQNETPLTAAPDQKQNYFLHAFVAAAFAVRKDLFLKIGGFRREYFYMGEEGDFCIRLLQEGFYVKAGTSVPAHHMQPPNRVSFKADFYGRRNDVLFAYYNVPGIYKLPYMAVTIAKGILFGLKVGRLGNMLKGTANGLKTISKPGSELRMISPEVYKRFRHMKKHEPMPAASLL